MRIARTLALVAALSGALAVMLGAFAAHGAGPQVKTLLTTGAHYQIVHALLALLCAAWPARTRLIEVAGWLSVVGGLAFGLALAMLGLLHLPIMGAVAPIGGVLMIAGWLLLAFAAFRSHSVNA